MRYIDSMKTAREIKQIEIERVVEHAVLRGKKSIKLSLNEVNHFNEDIEFWHGQLPFCTLDDANFLKLTGYQLKQVDCFNEEERDEIIRKSCSKRLNGQLEYPFLKDLAATFSSGFNPVVVEVSWF